MEITTRQYRQASKGAFLSVRTPDVGEGVTLIMPTGSGRRHIPVGNVARTEPVGTTRCLVWVDSLLFVRGMDY